MDSREARTPVPVSHETPPDRGVSDAFTLPPTTASVHPPDGTVGPPTYPGLLRCLLRDRLLLGAFTVCGLVIGYQIAVTLAHPSWIGPVTDWLRAALAWPELLIVVGVSLWLSRRRFPGACSWWLASAALLSYAVARTLWSVSNQLIFQHGVPFPTLPDLFFLLQYPFFFLAVILAPRTRFWGSRLILVLDGLLAIGAVAAVWWNFVMEPMDMASGISPLARTISLGYLVGDLFVLAALTITLLRPSRYLADRVVLKVLVAAVACLIVADAWAGRFLLSPPHVYPTGNPPDIFWVAFYLLVPLAALCQLRVAQQATQWGSDLASDLAVEGAKYRDLEYRSFGWTDFTASLRLFFPIVVALLASGALIVHATMLAVRAGWTHELVPFAVSAVLLVLILLRQQVTFLEMAQLRREADNARASERSMRELGRRKDEFLSVVSHELKTPLTSLQGYLEVLSRRLSAGLPNEGTADERGEGAAVRNLARARIVIQYARESVRRIIHLVDDLLDDAQIRDGRLLLHLEQCDLGVIVRTAVEEQQQLAPTRRLRLEAPPAPSVPVMADARRIAQVVTNFLTNALKYSKEDQPIEVRLAVAGAFAHVSVRDEGIGVPIGAQGYVWERFAIVDGNTVQSGSGVSLGVGLHISRSIIEGHHGRVGLYSVPGHGATFWFALPLDPPAT